jgi:hypothetical protein
MAASDVLRQMINDSDDQVTDIEGSIDQIDDLIDETDVQIEGLEDGMCDVAESDMTAYLQGPKLAEIQAIDPTAYLVFGGTYGSIAWSDPGPVGNITDWEYRVDLLIPPPPPAPPYTVVYSYTPGDDTTIDDLVNDFDFANDYLTRPLTDGASYGLKPYKNNLVDAKSLLTENKTKIADSKTALEDYAS